MIATVILTFLFLFTDATIFVFGYVVAWRNIIDCFLVNHKISGYWVWFGTQAEYKKIIADERKKLDEILERREKDK
jgi:hypothetical protein